MRRTFVIFALFLTPATNAAALGTGGCGSCDFPQEKAESAAHLERQIQGANHDNLRRLLFVGEVCATNGFECGNLSEEEASRLVQYHFDSSQAWWDAVQKVGLGFVAFAGLGLGLANRYRPRS